MDRLDPRIRSKLEALQAEAQRSFFRRHRCPVSVETYDEPKKLCHKCKEAWPATSEFFYRSPDGTLRSPCRACIDEKRAETAAVKPCAYPGCTGKRYHWRSSYCYEHRESQRRKAAS